MHDTYGTDKTRFSEVLTANCRFGVAVDDRIVKRGRDDPTFPLIFRTRIGADRVLATVRSHLGSSARVVEHGEDC